MIGGRFETLQLERDGKVLHVRLARPEVRNAFNGTVVAELTRVFSSLTEDDPAHVVVLSGAGKSFSAGADLAWMTEQSELPEAENERSAAAMAGAFLAIARCVKPVVVRAHGHALGGGTGLVAAADIAIAAEGTVFGLTEVKLGIVPAVISPFVMQKIGAGRARTLFLTGARFDGREAERIGLVHRAVPEEGLDAAVQAVVAELLTAGPRAVASAKQLIAAVAGLSLEDAIPVTSAWIARLRATPEAREGMGAFLAKRPPSWIG
ncbi:MAG: enoyl-CoA hydratase/isomerase family protein [Planctomycetes bacterium]|nr:enoyl-CoA hydratase/isomerase family protein [Planctomycetota bacterium]